MSRIKQFRVNITFAGKCSNYTYMTTLCSSNIKELKDKLNKIIEEHESTFGVTYLRHVIVEF